MYIVIKCTLKMRFNLHSGAIFYLKYQKNNVLLCTVTTNLTLVTVIYKTVIPTITYIYSITCVYCPSIVITFKVGRFVGTQFMVTSHSVQITVNSLFWHQCQWVHTYLFNFTRFIFAMEIKEMKIKFEN